MMNAGSNHAWWLAAMMNGGFGMFSSPVSVTRKRWVTTQRTTRTRKRKKRGAAGGAGWTRGSSGRATRSLYSGLRYRLRSAGSGVEESMEDSVELLRMLRLRRVTRAVDHGERRLPDQRLRAFG